MTVESYDVERIRSHFPALREGAAHFDGPGGSQTPRSSRAPPTRSPRPSPTAAPSLPPSAGPTLSSSRREPRW